MKAVNVLRDQHRIDFIVCVAMLLELSDGLVNDVWLTLADFLNEVIVPVPYLFWLLAELALR